ncbi:hypothetical protein DAPK24_022720 [Pichia kluyveri]|uniref:Uncharacterized protein n=1 Tax=Pichia kluyveri TaxID=36015 RepID=A0AAV5R3Y3_PICKL|nr:hypothetical protein DAPK24_022720 [Pichia kluyveri]
MKITNLIYKLLSSKNINDVQIRKGEEWKELVERKRKSITAEPIKYFKDTYYSELTKAFTQYIKIFLKCEICVQDRWMSQKFDYDIDERLKDVLNAPLFSVYLALSVCKGKTAETVN